MCMCRVCMFIRVLMFMWSHHVRVRVTLFWVERVSSVSAYRFAFDLHVGPIIACLLLCYVLCVSAIVSPQHNVGHHFHHIYSAHTVAHRHK